MVASYFGDYNFIFLEGTQGKMVKIRRVEQEDEQGCGIACVAMVAGKTYPQAKRFFLEHVFHPADKKLLTRHYQLRRVLQKLGIPSHKRLFRNWRSIEEIAIVPINRRVDVGWHWVIFVPNGIRPYIIDPIAGKGRRRYDFRGTRARGLYISIPRPMEKGRRAGCPAEHDRSET